MPTGQISIEAGVILEGKVQGITAFGAFVELAPGQVGLVHISEIANTYVKEIKDFVKEGDPVKVKVLSVDGRKIALSIRQAVPKPILERPVKARSPVASETRPAVARRMDPDSANLPTLDDKIARFLKESDERMQPLKNRIEPKKRNRYS